MKKVCLLIDSLKVGGKERVLSELAGYFSSCPGIEVHLILFGNYELVHYPVPDGVNLHIPSFAYQRNRRIWYAFKSLVFVRRQVRRIDPCVLMSFGEIWNSFVLLALYGLPYRLFISDRCQPDRKYNRMQRLLRKWLYPKAYGIIAQTARAKEIFEKEFRHRNIKVIGNPIREIQGKPSGSSGDLTVLTVGRLIPGKNHQKLIEVFHKLEMENWKLLIVGGDLARQPLSPGLQGYIRELGAEENVILAGEQEDVDAFYLGSDIFAFMSDSEGFPNVIGEAQSAGLPVVAYDCVAGPSDMILDGENGYLVPLHDAELFQERLQRLMQDAGLRKRFGEHAKESIKSFALEKIGASYLSFLLEEELQDESIAN